MKKLSFVLAAVAAVMMASCNQSAPQADLNTDVDSLGYAFGMSRTQGLKEYLVQSEMDTTYMDEFIKGLIEGANAGDDKKKAAYLMGITIGRQVSENMVKGLNYDLTGNDSTELVAMNTILAGFVDGVLQHKEKMTMEKATEYFETNYMVIKKRQTEEAYKENLEAGKTFMEKIAKKPGIKSLGNGIYYEVLTEGNGEIPSDTSMVTVNYEGKLVNDSIFDSSYQRGEPTNFRCNQVIPGWTTALTHMPKGSVWMVYIPQEQAYGEREAGMIQPYSALQFKIELIDVNTKLK